MRSGAVYYGQLLNVYASQNLFEEMKKKHPYKPVSSGHVFAHCTPMSGQLLWGTLHDRPPKLMSTEPLCLANAAGSWQCLAKVAGRLRRHNMLFNWGLLLLLFPRTVSFSGHNDGDGQTNMSISPFFTWSTPLIRWGARSSGYCRNLKISFWQMTKSHYRHPLLLNAYCGRPW